MLPDLQSTSAVAERRQSLPRLRCILLGLALSACSSNGDILYQGALQVRDKEAVAGLKDSRRVVVKDPFSQRPTEVHELVLGADGEEVRHGVERRYWPEGTLRSLRSFNGGQPAGVWWSWWRTGALRSAYVHSSNEATRMTWWHPNGFVSAEGMAVSGRRVGEWTYYHGNGVIESQGEMGGGHRIGQWSFFDESGEWTERGQYLGGQRVGDWEFRDRLGVGVPFRERR